MNSDNCLLRLLKKHVDKIYQGSATPTNTDIKKIANLITMMNLDYPSTQSILVNKMNDAQLAIIKSELSNTGVAQGALRGILMHHESYELGDTPLFEQSTYYRLPDMLKFIGKQDKSRNADVILMSILTALSSTSYFMRGMYFDNYLYPNLNAFVIAPSAQGKGNARNAERIITAYELEVNSGYNFGKKQFRHIISGNNSYANLISALNKNNGKGLIFETEGDVVSQNFKNDWGDYSTVIRQLFHNETIRYERKGNGGENIIIRDPKLALLLTMTPGQLNALVKSRENGMFSRVMFYNYNDEMQYMSPKPHSGRISAVDTSIDTIVKHYNELRIKSADRIIEFKLTDDQWTYFDTINEARFNKWPALYGQGYSDIITRLGLIMFKIAMVITTTRLDTNIFIKKVTCHDDDLETAKEITNVLFYHALSVSNIMPKTKQNTSSEPPLFMAVLDKMNTEFSTKEFVEEAKNKGVSQRTANRWLSRQDYPSFKSYRHGKYKKA